MEKYFNQIKNSSIFYTIEEEELKGLLKCLNARIKTYQKNDVIIREGQNINSVYLLLEGSANIEKDSYWGRRIIISQLNKNDTLALSYSISKNTECEVFVVANEETKILIIDYDKCSKMCHNACDRHSYLIKNLFNILSDENIKLIRKIENISQKTTKDKLLNFLYNEAKKQKSYKFKISFNRQDLADYLNIDRSAMCLELSKLKKEGIINYDKNCFIIKKDF